VAAAHAADGRLTEARVGYARATDILQHVVDRRAGPPGLLREIALGRVRLGFSVEADGDRTGRIEIGHGIDVLRTIADGDSEDARARHDLVSALVHLADAIRADEAVAARSAYQEARDVALALTAGHRDDSEAVRELALIDRRLSDVGHFPAADLKLFKTINGQRLLLQLGDTPPRSHTAITAASTVAPGWSQYLLMFGANGPAELLGQDQQSEHGWTVSLAGPPPAQTILLLALPRALSEAERSELLHDLNAIEGPRTVDWDAQIIWTLTDDTIESTAATRGGYARWVRAVRDRIARFGRVALSGRTFPLTPGG
jgi:hypothetical protein